MYPEKTTKAMFKELASKFRSCGDTSVYVQGWPRLKKVAKAIGYKSVEDKVDVYIAIKDFLSNGGTMAQILRMCPVADSISARLPNGKVKKFKKPKPIKPRKSCPEYGSLQDFLDTKEGKEAWGAVRYEALKKSNGCCSCCGRSPSKHGVVLHVDHIKPKSLYPELAFDVDNLQVLCGECNIGKSNRDEIRW